MTPLEVYGVVPFEEGMSVGSHDLVPFRAIAAVASPAAYLRRHIDEKIVADYAEIIEAIYVDVPILPVPPGTVFRSKAALSRWLELHYVALTDALSALEGNTAARLTIRLRSGDVTEESLKQWQALATECVRSLQAHVGAGSVAHVRANGDDPSLLARTSFLIERDRWTAFESGVDAERRRHPHLEFRLTGPWPPYDFVRMQFGN